MASNRIRYKKFSLFPVAFESVIYIGEQTSCMRIEDELSEYTKAGREIQCCVFPSELFKLYSEMFITGLEDIARFIIDLQNFTIYVT